jgi:4-diphosphocytidyl-2-C-methyl-D-erythritol kinase
MESLRLASYAKVNLALDVLEKRPEDGYHGVRMVMVPISLADTVTVTKADTITVECTPDVAGPMDLNLAYRAAVLLRKATGYTGGARIAVEKVIPVAGGMAGGSTNGAAVLRGLNRLWATGLNNRELMGLAIQLGSDVPFFIPQVPARVEGIGERVTPVPVTCPVWLALATPPVAKSTGNVYRLFDELEWVDRPDVPAMEAALRAGDISAVADALGNVFEAVMLPRHPEIAACKAAMLQEGALGALMSGAGPTVFGVAPDRSTAARIAERLSVAGNRTYVAQVVLPEAGYGT